MMENYRVHCCMKQTETELLLLSITLECYIADCLEPFKNNIISFIINYKHQRELIIVMIYIIQTMFHLMSTNLITLIEFKNKTIIFVYDIKSI